VVLIKVQIIRRVCNNDCTPFHFRRSVQVLDTLEDITVSPITEHVKFLGRPVVVYSILVVSAGNCTVDDNVLLMNVSIRDRSVEG